MPARFVAARQRAMADYTISPSELWYNNRINPVIIQIYMPAQFVALRQQAMADYTTSPSESWYNDHIK